MYYCENCADTNCCERTDIWGEPILCDKCYKKAKAWEMVLILIVVVAFVLLLVF